MGGHALLTADEVAERMRVSRATICRWCASGRLPAFRVGKGWRVNRSELDALIQRTIQERNTDGLAGLAE
ncbi:MAG: helix-turn-helix domain-containing protein [Chloroflexales bacterium]